MSGTFTADFATVNGRLNPYLYGSGLHVFTAHRHITDFFEDFKALRFPIVRNHDWALNNPNQRMIDIHHIFPLMHLDPTDGRNYVFAPSDEVIRLVYEAGSKVFYRLGTSIEHTEGFHFNANPPEDFDKYAEVCAGVIRHYTKGWNNGFHYDMKYWEIWNEPEGRINMWTGTDEQFAVFFATVLKRLKSEFPELKIGGPAHCSFRADLIDMLKAECDKRNVVPDFYSYHMYANNLKTSEAVCNVAREYLDKIGWTKTETCLNEWHFIRRWGGVHSNITEESYQKTMNGADGLMGINSAAFNIGTFCIWQNSKLDSAFYYGCGTSNWGVKRPSTRWNKNYYSLLMMRDSVYDFPIKAAISGGTDTQRALALLSEDGKRAAVLIGDLCGSDMDIAIDVKGFAAANAKLVILDDIRDNVTVDIAPGKDGLYHFSKEAPGSVALMLILEK